MLLLTLTHTQGKVLYDMANNSNSLDTCYPRRHLAHYLRLITLVSVIALQGCAYTVTSTVSTIATGKSISDHALSTTGNDCNTLKYTIGRQDYLCEQPRTPDSTYNRNHY